MGQVKAQRAITLISGVDLRNQRAQIAVIVDNLELMELIHQLDAGVLAMNLPNEELRASLLGEITTAVASPAKAKGFARQKKTCPACGLVPVATRLKKELPGI